MQHVSNAYIFDLFYCEIGVCRYCFTLPCIHDDHYRFRCLRAATGSTQISRAKHTPAAYKALDDVVDLEV